MMMQFARAFYLLQRSMTWCRLRHIGFVVALFGLVALSTWDTGIPVVVDGPLPSDKTGQDPSAISTPFSFSSTAPKFSDSLATVLTNQHNSINEPSQPEGVRPISCQDVRARVQRAEWTDPNHGILYARNLVTDPHFRMAVHAQSYDNVRWKSIYLKGEYYETLVHQRFVHILQNAKSSQLVIDVGMNIGYYTMLSATLGHNVIGFEINPANLIRVCESLDVNQMDDSGSASSPVAIFQRGVSNVNDQILRLVIPSNPGQARLVTTTTTTGSSSNGSDDGAAATTAGAADTVTTITLDAFATAYNWWETRPSIALLKIDVEGLEPEIILGAEQLLKTGLVQHVVTEFRDFNTPNANQAFRILIDNGYVLTNDDGTPLTLAATMDLWHDYGRGKYHQSWRRTTRAFLLRRPFVMDIWFSLQLP
jgi:FkbM family methyltransferase